MFHDTEPMSRLTTDVYAIQFPSPSTETHESNQINQDGASAPTNTTNSFVNMLVLNRVRLASGRFERFGAPIGKFFVYF